MNEKVSFRKSLKVRLLGIVFCCMFIGFGMVSYSNYRITKSSMIELLGDSTIKNVEGISSILLESIKSYSNELNSDGNSDALMVSISSYLSQIKENFNYKNVFMIYEDGKVMRYFADSEWVEGDKFVNNTGQVVTEFNENEAITKAFDGKSAYYEDVSNFEGRGHLLSVYVPIKSDNGYVEGVVVIEEDAEDLYWKFRDVVGMNGFYNLGTQCVILVSILWVLAIVNKKLKRVLAYVSDLGNNKLDTVVTFGELDEIDRIHKVLYDSIQKLRLTLNDTATTCEEVKSGLQLTIEGVESFEGSYKTISGSIENMVSRVETSTAFSQEIVASVEEISESILVMNDNFETLAQSRTSIDKLFQQGNESIASLNSLIEESVCNIETKLYANNNSMNSSLEKLTEVISSINKISEAINLLSLNAGIESARAGDAGKGFAVISNEILKLSKDTEEIVKSVLNGLGDLKVVVNESNELAVEINSSLNTQGHKAEQVAQFMDSINNNLDNFTEVFSVVGNKLSSINESKESLSDSIVHIANTMQDTFVVGGEVLDVVNESVGNVNSITESLVDLNKSFTELDNKVNVFEIK